MAFELDCEFIFLETDNIRLIHRFSSMRPKAFLIVFSDNPKVKGAVAIDFGVYVYPKGHDQNPVHFLKTHGENYGYSSTQKIRVLKIELEHDRVVSSRIHEIN